MLAEPEGIRKKKMKEHNVAADIMRMVSVVWCFLITSIKDVIGSSPEAVQNIWCFARTPFTIIYPQENCKWKCVKILLKYYRVLRYGPSDAGRREDALDAFYTECGHIAYNTLHWTVSADSGQYQVRIYFTGFAGLFVPVMIRFTFNPGQSAALMRVWVCAISLIKVKKVLTYGDTKVMIYVSPNLRRKYVTTNRKANN